MPRRKVRKAKLVAFPEAAVIAALTVLAISVVSAGFFVTFGYSTLSFSTLSFSCDAQNCMECCGSSACSGAGSGMCRWSTMGQSAQCDTGICQPICGNSVKQGFFEACDKTDLNGKTCADAKGADWSGTLKCSTFCSFDTSECSAPVCGNGINGTTEQCDDSNLQDGDGCDGLCFAETGWNCTGGTGLSVCNPACGDNLIVDDEVCDGTNLADDTCVEEGFTGGTLKCKADCSGFDKSGCTVAPTVQCGNSIVDTGEQCDGTQLGNATCVSQGFIGGPLACAADCTFDTSGCTAAPTTECGNSKLEEGEDCDGTKLGGETCTGLGFTGGTLKCADDCTFDTSKCTSAPVVTAEDAQEAITAAQQDIITAQSANKNTTDAVIKVNEAITAFGTGDYATSQTKAKAASLSAKMAPEKQTAGAPVVMIGVGIVIIGVGAAIAYYLLKVRPKMGAPAVPAPAPTPA